MNPIRILLDKLAPLALKIQGQPLYRALGRRLRPAVVVRAASPEEACRALNAIYQAATAYHPGPNVTPFIAYRGSDPVGCVELVRRDPLAGDESGYWLFSLYVRNRYRGLGVGEDLCRAVMDMTAAEGEDRLSLYVLITNGAAQTLYRKLGFYQVTGEQELSRLGYQDDPVYPQMVMQRRLR